MHREDSFEENKNGLAGVGMTFKLRKIINSEIQDLIIFLNSDEFHECLNRKFSISRPTKMSTRIQKYLSGYEITPHPDIRSKALTYLFNINPSELAEKMDIHTHLLTLKPEYEYIKAHWARNKYKDRNMIPWEWCETQKVLSKGNSLVMFAPSNDTLHGAKLKYDHCAFQRTNIYGNLRFTDVPVAIEKTPYQELYRLIKNN